MVERQQIRHRYDESIFHLAAREVLSIIGLRFLRVSYARERTNERTTQLFFWWDESRVRPLMLMTGDEML